MRHLTRRVLVLADSPMYAALCTPCACACGQSDVCGTLHAVCLCLRTVRWTWHPTRLALVDSTVAMDTSSCMPCTFTTPCKLHNAPSGCLVHHGLARRVVSPTGAAPCTPLASGTLSAAWAPRLAAASVSQRTGRTQGANRVTACRERAALYPCRCGSCHADREGRSRDESTMGGYKKGAAVAGGRGEALTVGPWKGCRE
eukprot:366492-Chlamydomonas_euryale.AAC.8